MLFVDRPILRPDPQITDLAPTILELPDVPLPEDLDGRPIP